MNATPHMNDYFNSLKSGMLKLHQIAATARTKGFDPENKVEVSIAENMAQRVVGLISVVAPQIADSGVVERIIELEKQYGTLDWRVALKIAEEIAQQKYCTFETQKEAMEVGIRTGFAYVTVGVVSSPLDGIVNIEIKKRMDGKDYICVNFAGPIRNAGGTAAAVCVIITDYVRHCMGYDVYDVQPNEVKRAITELRDYHERITNLQYFPSDKEVDYLLKHLPVEVSGDPSEKIEVSNYKDLPRIPTDRIRSGYCLVLSSCIPLKAPKLWKQLSKWGKEFHLDTWNFLEQFLAIQKKAKSQSKTDAAVAEKITPDYTYIKDLVAGRPVLGAPLAAGGFRLRYGKGRINGYSAQSIHPATMYILNSYIATGTQLKTERPGKAASITHCDTIDGPIIKLEDGTVKQLRTLEEAKECRRYIKEILFLGDTLIAYGDFFNRAQPLVPAGYCPEWWAQEVLATGDIPDLAQQTEIPEDALRLYLEHPLAHEPPVHHALHLAKTTHTPLHPAYVPHWNVLSHEEFVQLLGWLEQGKIHTDEQGVQKIVLPKSDAKRILELVGLPHLQINNEFTVIEQAHARMLTTLFSLTDMKASAHAQHITPEKQIIDIINAFSPIKLRDKSGTFIGTRMGRPEKAKQRALTGSPHVIFPVGEEGGRLRSFQSALDKGKITSDFPFYRCSHCNADTVFSICEVCTNPTTRKWKCAVCGIQDTDTCKEHGQNKPCEERSIPIKHYFDSILKQLKLKIYPDLIKGVRGTSNKEHVPEHLAKGILRAKYDIHVYKDGTTRYDMTQLPITHFKPCEIGTNLEKLKHLGYSHDINGHELTSADQILELKPQDIILPDCDEGQDHGAGKVLSSIAKYIDDELVHLYNTKPVYSLTSEEDLVGHLTIVLAPHTSAGTLGRIIGFTKTQGLFAHPLLHAATRRDCDGDEACVILLMDAFLNFSKSYLPGNRGSTMDTPLVLTSSLTPSEVDDMVFDIDIAWHYPLELYEAALQYKQPWDVPIHQIKNTLNTPEQYEKMGFTHDTDNINHTVRCSAYKTLPSMEEKLKGQMDIAEKLRSIDATQVAQLVIEKHFIKDTKGNLRKFSTQRFRCVHCNAKFRRPPLIGKCTTCSGKIIFTISEGSIVKYLEPSISLAEKYNVPPYLKQTIELLRHRIENVFGKDPEKQLGLGMWFA